MNSKSVHGIMNKRTLLTEAMIGKKVQLTIRGNGTLVDVKTKTGELVQSVVEPGTVFQKYIFNTESNSGIALANVNNKTLAAEGMAHERAGNVEEAHKSFSSFLNAVQVSFNIPATAGAIIAKLGDRVDISARVVKVTTENGSLLTLDPATISVLTPEALVSTTFDMSAFTGLDFSKHMDTEAKTAEQLELEASLANKSADAIEA